jgi:hypothetical protein
VTGGPPVRGTKLLAWRTPKVFSGNTGVPENSMVPHMQDRLKFAIDSALAAVAADVRQGLLQIVGLESEWWTDDQELASVVVYLPENIDREYAWRAIEAENLEAWLDEEKRLHVAISPFYTTKDVDQTVLCVVKVVCQFTGLIDVADASHDFYHKH